MYAVQFESLRGTCTLNFASTSNRTYINDFDQLRLDKVKQGMSEFLQIIEVMDESLSGYSEEIIHQLDHDIQKGITDLKKLQESLIPKNRRRPPVETWNSTASTT